MGARCPMCGGAMSASGDCRDDECRYSLGPGPYVQVVVGRCPECGSTTESADTTGLEGLKCAQSHEPAGYVPADVYYESAARTWEVE